MKGFFRGFCRCVMIAVVVFLASLFMTVCAFASDGDGGALYSVSFYNMGELYYEYEAEEGATLTIPSPPRRAGYDFDCWRIGSQDGSPLDTTYKPDSHIRLYASYKLSSPEFEISSLSFEYDGSEHKLAFSKIEHPLLDGGFLSFDWYKNGESLGHHASSISIKDVSDSGEYTCIITFSVMGDSSVSVTPSIAVAVLPAVVDLPKIPAATYTGDEIFPQIFDTGVYFVERKPFIQTGIYPIALTLRDAENYTFRDLSSPVAYVDFEITRAENYWLGDLTVRDVYTCDIPSPSAQARFGTPSFEYSTDGVSFSAKAPDTAGEYYVRAIVSGTENYTVLISDTVKFTVIAEHVEGIAVATPATRLKYVAFERFDPAGLTVAVTYNSGRRELVGADELTFSYPRGDSFRFADRGIVISYGSASVLLLVEVMKADYDISAISFSDVEVQYDGQYRSIGHGGALPLGLDGIPLRAEVVGGGTDSGTYTVRLDLFSDSENYNSPPPLYATLTVLPCQVSVVWSSLSFVYDGTAKLPTAHYLDVYGRKNTLTPMGERSLAGDYEAFVLSQDENYVFINPTASFRITKADYDMSGVSWCGGGEAYSGSPHEVYLTALPVGVSVVGYVDNRATAAGTYVARASLSYDTANYNPPTVPDYIWKILPAAYPTDTYSFSDSTYVFDGNAHYPALTGTLPVGADGVPLQYSFSLGATHVSEGRVAVEINFFTDSNNYIPPNSIVRYVQIIPLSITVSWHALDFVYDGTLCSPYAVSDVCTVTVTGGATNAGTYAAFAVADNSDYEILNSTCEFTVHKADNSWSTPLSVTDIFFGTKPAPHAVSLAGEVIYEYFFDSDCTDAAPAPPTDVGTYYVRALSKGDSNHYGIVSDSYSFSIIAVIPVSLSASLGKCDFLAFDTVSSSDVLAVLVNNDGSETVLDSSLVEIIYSAESLRYGDTSIELRYADFSVTLPISVERRSYDMSSVVWEGVVITYDGTAQYATLTGLPDGVEVLEYVGNGNVLAGEYTVSALLAYDEWNYNAPDTPHTVMKIRKLVIPLPEIDRAVYCGAALLPTLPSSPYYTCAFSIAPIAAGSYPVAVTLSDPQNCEFSGGGATATVDFVVEPRRITVTVDSATLYLFENAPSPTWRITEGALVGKDTLSPRFYERDGRIYAEISDSNYAVTVIPGDLVRRSVPSPDALSTILIIIFALLALTLATFAVIKNRRRIYYAYRAHLCRADMEERETAPPAIDPEPECDTVADTPSDSIDVEYADTAITNSLAKDLIRHDDSVVTTGNRKGIINVDTLSDNFEAGDRVDINILKSRQLIPYDTGYIKVLARGVVDKPLFVYANDFSLSAVKMIALKGGRAIKVTTVSKIKLSKGIEIPDEK